MSISGRDEEDLAPCSTKDTDREARKSHAPQAPSPTEFVTAIPQETFDQGMEYTIPLEESDSQEAREVEDRYSVDPEAETKVCRSRSQEAGHDERSEDWPSAPREGGHNEGPEDLPSAPR